MSGREPAPAGRPRDEELALDCLRLAAATFGHVYDADGVTAAAAKLYAFVRGEDVTR